MEQRTLDNHVQRKHLCSSVILSQQVFVQMLDSMLFLFNYSLVLSHFLNNSWNRDWVICGISLGDQNENGRALIDIYT